MSLSVIGVVAEQPTTVRQPSPLVVMPIESASVRASVADREHIIDRSAFLLLPANTTLRLRRDVSVARLALLTFGAPLMKAFVHRYMQLGATHERLQGWLATPALLPRTTWVHEIVHRYVFERYVLDAHDNDATTFLEVEILKELYFLLRDRDEGPDRAAGTGSASKPVQRALAYIDAHLLEPVSLPALVRNANVSESSLVRAFRRELNAAPASFWRSRKLDEAMVLLRSGALDVSEISMEVGYESPTAFAFAFRKRFGNSPSFFKRRGPARSAP